MTSVLDDIRDGFGKVVNKTEEYGKIGKLKVDIVGFNRQIEKLHKELGQKTYEILSSEGSKSVANNNEVKDIVKQITEWKDKIKAKEREIEQIKQEKEKERQEREAERAKRQEAEEKQKAESAEKAESVSLEDDTNKEPINKSDAEDAKIIDEEKKEKQQ